MHLPTYLPAEKASELRHALIHAQMLFARIGLSVNFAKTKILPIRAQFNSESTVPARVYEGDQWRLCRNSLVRECIAQPQSDPTPVTIECFNSYLHFGHLIHTTWDLRCTHDELMSEFSQEIDVWNNRPLPVRAQLQVINSVLIPKIVYRLQCIPIVWDLLLKIQRWLKDFLLAIVGLPTFLCNKTLYSSHKFGLGLLHIPVVVATRMLDNVSNVLCKYGAHHLMHSQMGYFHILQSVVIALHAETSASVLPLGGTSDVQEVLNYGSFWHVEIQNWVWQCKHYIDTEHSAYSDGSFFESCNKCAGAAVLEDGRTLCVRPPGYQSAYKAEVYGMFLACEYSSSCAIIFTDCNAVLKAVKYRKERVVEARLIRLIGEHVDRKHMSLQYVRGHSGIPGNEEVDRRAKAAVNLPDAPVQIPVEVGDVSYHGELFTYSHKVWTRHETPTHRHKGVWSGCWKQLNFGFTIWIRWFFGGIVSPGYSFPLTYWHPEHTGAIDPQRGSLCKTYHKKSVHGYLGHFGENSKLVQIWLNAWGPLRQKVLMWRRVAMARDLHIVGRLLLPCSLVSELAQQEGRRQCKRAIHKFHARTLKDLAPELPRTRFSHNPPQSLKRSVFKETDWMVEVSVTDPPRKRTKTT